MQDQMNFGLKYLDNIKDLAIYCQIICDQILATDQVQLNTKPANTKVANTPIRFILPTKFVLPLFQTILLDINGYCPKPRNIFSHLPIINGLS